MHETRLVNRVIAELLDKNIKQAKLRLGRLHCRADVFKELFKAQIKGTPLKGIELEVEQVPVKVRCACGFTGRVSVMDNTRLVRCPKCGEIVEPLTGNELEIVY